MKTSYEITNRLESGVKKTETKHFITGNEYKAVKAKIYRPTPNPNPQTPTTTH